MTDFYLSYNFSSQQIHQVLKPRDDSEIRRFRDQVDHDRSASPGINNQSF